MLHSRTAACLLVVLSASALALSFTFAQRAGSPVEAGTAVRMDVDGLLQGSRLAFEARVVSAVPVKLPNGRIATDYRFRVSRTFWGDERVLRSVRLPGGVLPEGRGMLVPGLTHPVVGEDTLLFLAGDEEGGIHVPVGLSQGRFRILTGPRGERLAVRDHGPLALVDPGRVREADGTHVFEYADLLARIESAVNRRRALAPAQGR